MSASNKLDALQEMLAQRGSTPLKQGVPALEILRRPEITYADLLALGLGDPALTPEEAQQVEIQVKYEGYIKQQWEQVARLEKIENRLLPEDLNYGEISGLRNEAKQKLAQIRPASVGQASRISGVNPADISVLLIYLESLRRQGGQKS